MGVPLENDQEGVKEGMIKRTEKRTKGSCVLGLT